MTTGSLGALRSYAAGLRANDIQGDYPTAIQYFNDAIRQDSTFAMAYMQLAYSLQSLGGAVRYAQSNVALTNAFRLRDRLPERERYNVEGAYYISAEPDRTKAIPAFRRAVELDSSNFDAANSLGAMLHDVHDYAGAERAYRVALAGDPGNATILTNLAQVYLEMGRHSAFDSVITIVERSSGAFPTGPARFEDLWVKRDYGGAQRCAAVSAKPSDVTSRRTRRGPACAAIRRARTTSRSFMPW